MAEAERDKKRLTAWRSKNTERVAAYQAAYRASNKKRIAELVKNWSERNRGKRKKDLAAWRTRNKEHVRLYNAAYFLANKEEISAYRKAYKNENSELISVLNGVRRARQNGVSGRLSVGLTERLFSLQGGRCACCACDLSSIKYHRDHIVPLALGGPNVDSNIQLLCFRCNTSKHATDPIVFMQRRGFLL